MSFNGGKRATDRRAASVGKAESPGHQTLDTRHNCNTVCLYWNDGEEWGAGVVNCVGSGGLRYSSGRAEARDTIVSNISLF